MGNPSSKFGFHFGEAVRYKPGAGTYGYEDALQDDGRVAGVVVGFTDTRVRCEFKMERGRMLTRAVDPGSLRRDEGV